jgi:hypothetical protein
MGSNTYNVVKAPIGWSLFCNRERIGGYGSSEEALEAAMAFGTHALREGHGIQINVPGVAPEIDDIAKSRPAHWQFDLK